MNASRAQLVAEVILPALAEGKVICHDLDLPIESSRVTTVDPPQTALTVLMPSTL